MHLAEAAVRRWNELPRGLDELQKYEAGARGAGPKADRTKERTGGGWILPFAEVGF